MSFRKALTHATEVSFGEHTEVVARYHDAWGWCVFDSRMYAQGGEMLEDGLGFEEAVLKAYRRSLCVVEYRNGRYYLDGEPAKI